MFVLPMAKSETLSYKKCTQTKEVSIIIQSQFNTSSSFFLVLLLCANTWHFQHIYIFQHFYRTLGLFRRSFYSAHVVLFGSLNSFWEERFIHQGILFILLSFCSDICKEMSYNVHGRLDMDLLNIRSLLMQRIWFHKLDQARTKLLLIFLWFWFDVTQWHSTRK